MSIQLEVGKTYVKRNGDHVTLTGSEHGRTRPSFHDANGQWWFNDGRYAVGCQTPHDLVAETPGEITQLAAPAQEAASDEPSFSHLLVPIEIKNAWVDYHASEAVLNRLNGYPRMNETMMQEARRARALKKYSRQLLDRFFITAHTDPQSYQAAEAQVAGDKA